LATKACNLDDYDQVEEQRKLQPQELNEIHLKAYKNSKFYKEKTKHFHDHFFIKKVCSRLESINV